MSEGKPRAKAMHAATYEEIVRDISAKSDSITSQYSSLVHSITKSRISISLRSIHLAYRSYKILGYVTKVENKYCVSCEPNNCYLVGTLKDDFSKMANSMKVVIKKQKELSYPSFIIKLQQHIIDEFDNKIENYLIASDAEIRELTSKVVKKINQQHAVH